MNRWVDVAYRQACKKIAREKSERATFCIASITQWGELFFEVISYFSEKPAFFHSLQNMYREEKEEGRVQRYESIKIKPLVL
jgi:hypothetical protein